MTKNKDMQAVEVVENRISRLNKIIKGLKKQITLLNEEIGYNKKNLTKLKRVVRNNKKYKIIKIEKTEQEIYLHIEKINILLIENYNIHINNLIEKNNALANYRYIVYLILTDVGATHFLISKIFKRKRAGVTNGISKMRRDVKIYEDLEKIYNNLKISTNKCT